MTAAEDLKQAFLALLPRIRALAVEPIRTEDEAVERGVLDGQVSMLLHRIHGAGLDPDLLAPGWGESYSCLHPETRRAGAILAQTKTVAGRLEKRRYEMMLAAPSHVGENVRARLI